VGEVVIATDDVRIFNEAKSFGADVIMTSPHHENGTERIAEVALLKGWDKDEVLVNLQGDEPLVPQELIEQTAQSLLQFPEAGMSSICTPIDDKNDIFDPNVVKVVLDCQGFAMYFSRAPIPWDRDNFPSSGDVVLPVMPVYRHVGMYGYRVSFLQEYARMQKCSVEITESLEQLRALWYGIKIHMSIIDKVPGHGVDVIEDIVRVEAALKNMAQ
jgi:3-deoxy-manno-octulosonate cytidylyltransferase (CMP-KDO synthetase)